MDNLAKDAFMAKQNGMSYGKYMATKKPAYKTEDAPPRGAKVKFVCAVCGSVFYRYDRRAQKYCSLKCKQKVDNEREKKRYRDGKTESNEVEL